MARALVAIPAGTPPSNPLNDLERITGLIGSRDVKALPRAVANREVPHGAS
jgi:hypothetical protein